MVMAGLAPSGAQGAPLLGAQPHLTADGLSGDEHGGQGGNAPEHTESDRLGFDGPLRHVGAGFDPERDGTSRMGSRDLPLHRGDVADAVSKLEIRRRAGDATLDQPVGEGRRIDDLRRVGGVQGVEHHLIVEGDDPDDLHVHRQVRLGLEGGGPPGAVAGQRRLGIGVEADRDHLAHVQAQRLGHDRRHHDLIGPLRVGQSPRYRSETVLIGELAVDAAVVVENADAEGVSLGRRRGADIRSARAVGH